MKASLLGGDVINGAVSVPVHCFHIARLNIYTPESETVKHHHIPQHMYVTVTSLYLVSSVTQGPVLQKKGLDCIICSLALHPLRSSVRNSVKHTEAEASPDCC